MKNSEQSLKISHFSVFIGPLLLIPVQFHYMHVLDVFNLTDDKITENL